MAESTLRMGLQKSIPEWLYQRWDKTGRFPRWARLLWPRIHFCNELDGLLVDGARPQDLPFDCHCVEWPPVFEVYLHAHLFNHPLTAEAFDCWAADPARKER